ncbi:hypothetical protein H9W90_01035 [Polaribacter pectinis]|uniref:tRNA (Guanine-N1)-methyltransferase n=1 Tax=Polaribacter pectinis TaxID=2738844 RepID=A0A7G9LAU1_9FLAO|nr:hypothetical protein [Polaribacter pectinis]QNM85740.1 hypothetical protein H9W90_01035 [Polaribacter pectinis]
MRLLIIVFTTILLSTISYAQETTELENTLENQFDKIYRTSTSYQTYKVISKERFQLLKKNVLDSLKESKSLVIEKEKSLKAEKASIQETKETLNKTKQELEIALNKENSISLFGIQLSKTTYNLILWSLIAVLLFSLLYFIYKFSKGNIITQKAENGLQEVEQEFEQYRKKSLEREQKLRRQLQDEINKQRNL